LERYESLLNTRICDLKLNVNKSPLAKRISQLYSELRAKNLRFRPPCYFADEWFVPEGDPVIGIPFYLAGKRLIALERRMMGEAEGDNVTYFMKLLRHEAGHALTYAYRLNRKRSYAKVFGPSFHMFSDIYKYQTQSKKFVKNLNDYYAQSHPDEDFAETFSVWVSSPEHQWRRQYQGWAALDKLLYVDELMTQIVGKAPLVKTGEKMCHVSTLKYTVWTYYMRRRSILASHRVEKHR